MNKLKIAATILLVFIENSFCFAEAGNHITVAIERFNQSVVNYSNVNEKCRQDEKILPDTIFKEINASTDDKKIALKYYYIKSIADCTEDAVKKFLLASAIRSFADDAFPRNLRDGDGLIISVHLDLLKAEFEYNSISDENKKAFEAIKELHSPFDLVKSAKALGLY